MADEDKKSRFAELSMELMGAKLVGEFVQQVWAAASKEVKAELAEAVVKRVTAQLRDGSGYQVTEAIGIPLRAALTAEAQRQLDGRKSELIEVVRRGLESRWAGAVEDVTSRLLKSATEAVKNGIKWPSIY